VSEEMHASLHKQKSVRIGAASSTLFSSEIWVSFWKEYFFQIIVFKLEKSSLDPNWPIHVISRNKSMWQSKTVCVDAAVSSTFFPYEKWDSFWLK
jgi:hypothetical protein